MDFHDVVTTATNLIGKIVGAKEGQPIKTVIEVVGVVCEIVEGTAVLLWKQRGQALSGPDKAQLACQIALVVLDALYDQAEPLVSTAVYNVAKQIVTDLEALIPMIDGVIAITKMAPRIQQIISKSKGGDDVDKEKGCLCS